MVVVAAKTSCSARLGIKYDFRDLSIFDGGAVVIAGGAEEEEDSLAGRGALVDHLLQPLGAVVGIRAFEGGARCVAHVGQDLDGFLEHDPECVGGPITTEAGIILSQGLFFLIFDDLDIHLIIRGTMDRPVQTKADDGDSSVHREPDAVTGPTVAPTALDLLEPVDAALLAPEAAPGPVGVLHAGFRVDGKVQKEVHHFTIRQNPGLGRACCKLLNCHQWKPD